MMTILGYLAYALRSIGWDAELDPRARHLRVRDNRGRRWVVEVRHDT